MKKLCGGLKPILKMANGLYHNALLNTSLQPFHVVFQKS